MKTFKCYLVVALSMICLSASAQIKVYPVKGTLTLDEHDGLFYALPKTHLKIDVLIQNTVKIRGPLYAYAETYLGLNDVQAFDESIYEMKNVWMNSYVQPDPDQLFYVSIDKRSKDDKTLLLSLSESGLILGVNKQVDQAIAFQEDVNITLKSINDNKAFQYFAANNYYQKTDTIIRRISIDTVNIQRYSFNTTWLIKDLEQKAKEAVVNLEKIREQRFLLLTGYQEVDYGEAMAYMDGQLKKMEAELISLFTGIVTHELIHKTFYFTPGVGNTSRNIAAFKFSESEGAFDLTDSRGENVYIQISPQNLTTSIEHFLQSSSSEADDYSGFYYRIPEYADVELRFQNERLFKSNFIISQFGRVVQTPSIKSEIEFHPNTGNVKNIRLR